MTERPARPAGRISVCIRFGDGTEVSRRGLDYVGLKVLIEKRKKDIRMGLEKPIWTAFVSWASA